MSTFCHHLALLEKYSLTPLKILQSEGKNTPSQNLGLAGLNISFQNFVIII
jgi:hypothetical protein